MTQQSKIGLLIADDHDVIRSGLKAMLEGSDIKVVAAVASGQEAVKYALENQVDVVLLDVCMSDGDGLNALGRIKLQLTSEWQSKKVGASDYLFSRRHPVRLAES